MPLDENKIKNMNVKAYKKFIKKKISQAAFTELTKDQKEKSKIKLIKYKKLSCQKYIRSGELSNSEINLLFKIRSKMVNVKCNFKNGNTNLECQLGCGENFEDQAHILSCKKLLEKYPCKDNLKNVKYDDIFASVRKQKRIITVFKDLLNIRESLLSP